MDSVRKFKIGAFAASLALHFGLAGAAWYWAGREKLHLRGEGSPIEVITVGGSRGSGTQAKARKPAPKPTPPQSGISTGVTAPVAPPAAPMSSGDPGQGGAPGGPASGGRADGIRMIGDAKPQYPSLSRKMGEEGEVAVRIEINKDGQVAQATLARTSGYTRLDAAAVEFLKKARFELPSVVDAPIEKTISIVFRLDEP